jgi:hypothetical protein
MKQMIMQICMEARNILEAYSEEPENCVQGMADLSVSHIVADTLSVPSTETTGSSREFMSESVDLNAFQDNDFYFALFCCKYASGICLSTKGL